MAAGDTGVSAESVWEIPEPSAACEIAVDADTRITLRRHGNPDGPRLVLSHGNGLAVDLYYPFWSLLADDFDLVVYDLRNHGWNAVGPREAHSLPTFVRDHDRMLEAIDDQFGAKPKVGVFHSVSALTTLLSSATDGAYEARVLFDPPVCKPGRSQLEFDLAAERTAAMTRSRADRFRTVEDYAEVLGISPAFTRMVPGARELMARTTLRESADGEGLELRCPKEYEAQIIDYARVFAVLVNFEALSCPTKVVGADPTLPYSYLPTFDLTHVLTVDYDFVPEATHFLPLENPGACAAAVRDFVSLQCLY